DSLELLGIVPKEAIIDCDQVPIISASKMLIPCQQVSGNYPRWICQFLRERFLPHAIKNNDAKRIYISRENAYHRKVSNESEIIELLKTYGIVSVRLEELSFGEQLRLFYNAELVIGPHGSGLGNIVFCSKGTQVIELFPATTTDAIFALSKELELDYYFLRARKGNPNSNAWNFGNDNFSIDLEDLLKTLEFAGVSPS
ncbi:MAG: glycosyltransferase family 61 protein, partial [Nitrospirales bacterium]